MRLEPFGSVTGFEKADGQERRRIHVNQHGVNGIVFVKNERFVENAEEILISDIVYSVGRDMFSVKPYCENCHQEQFLLDDDTLHCPSCENK